MYVTRATDYALMYYCSLQRVCNYTIQSGPFSPDAAVAWLASQSGQGESRSQRARANVNPKLQLSRVPRIIRVTAFTLIQAGSPAT